MFHPKNAIYEKVCAQLDDEQNTMVDIVKTNDATVDLG